LGSSAWSRHGTGRSRPIELFQIAA
jgi:hypothetical protein